MADESGAGTGIGGRALPLPVTVRQILRDGFVVVLRSGVQTGAAGGDRNHGAAAVAGIGVLLSMSGGCWAKLSPVRCRAGGCLLLWRQRHRLGETLYAADEFGAWPHPELAVGVAEMEFDRLRAEEQRRGGLAVGAPPGPR